MVVCGSAIEGWSFVEEGLATYFMITIECEMADAQAHFTRSTSLLAQASLSNGRAGPYHRFFASAYHSPQMPISYHEKQNKDYLA